MISAVILTKNEEANIARCIKSVLWCDEIIVVDDYSDDGTIEKCNNEKIHIHKRHLDNYFSKQRNFGLEKARGEWIIFVDADEVISEELASEIKSQISSAGQTEGFYLNRKDFFLGKWLKYGETANVRLLRLAKKNSGRWERKIHEKWQVKGKTEVLNNSLEHYPHPTVAGFLKKINTYTDIVAQSWKEQGRKISSLEIVVFPLGKFIHNYLVKFGLLDGVPGFIMAVMMSFHSFLVRGKYWLIIHPRNRQR